MIGYSGRKMPAIFMSVLVMAVSFVMISCGPSPSQIRRLQQLEEGVSNPTTIEELEEAIAKYQTRVEDIVSAETRIGSWYKILGTRYFDNKMYGKALETFQTAIEYYPANQNLFCYVGMCAGYMAKAALDYSASGNNPLRENYLNLAESAYLRAIELEPRYVRALYGLSIIYVFEKDEPEKAIPHLELVTEIEKRNFSALMVLARAFYSTGESDRAVEIYDKIINEAKDEEVVGAAKANKSQVLQEAYNGAI